MKNVPEFSGEQNSAEWTNSRQNGKTERARKLGRKTREEIGQVESNDGPEISDKTETQINIRNYKSQN